MKNVSRKAVLFCVFLLVLQSVALLSHSESTGVQGTSPPAVQDGVAVSSSEGPVATWGRGLDAPAGYGAGVPAQCADGHLLRDAAPALVARFIVC